VLLAWLLGKDAAMAKAKDTGARTALHCALLPQPKEATALFEVLASATGQAAMSERIHDVEGGVCGGETTLLTAAIRGRSEEVIRILLSFSVDVNIADGGGLTPLMWATRVNDVATVKQVLMTKADCSVVDGVGRGVLHHCVQPLPIGSYENVALLRILIEAKAGLDLKDSSGKVPMALALGQDSGRMATVLKEAGAQALPNPARFGRAKSAILTWSTQTVDFEADAEAALAAAKDEGSAGPRPVHKCYGMEGQNEVAVLEGEAYDVMMVKVDIKKGEFGENNFYHMQLVHERVKDLYVLFTRWGRIGETGMFQRTPQDSVAAAKKEWGKLFKSKSGNEWEKRGEFTKQPNRYSLLALEHAGVKRADLLKPFAKQVEVQSTLPSDLQRTLRTVTSVAMMRSVLAKHDINTDAMPFGRMSRQSLQEGLSILKSISDQIEIVNSLKCQPGVDGSMLTAAKMRLLELSSDFYTLVPRAKFASEPVQPIRTERQVSQEWQMLQDLLEMEVAAKILLAAKSKENELHPLDYVFKSLRIVGESMQRESDEYKLLERYLQNTNDSVLPRVSAVYRLQRQGEAARMEAKCRDLGRRRLLWHGTPASNLVGILAQGLRVAPPEAPTTGYMFGKGIYFADMASKSLGYCRAGAKEAKYLILAEVALGEMLQAKSSMYLEAAAPGTQSTQGMGKRGPDWDTECVFLPNGVQIPLGKPVTRQEEQRPAEPLQLAHNEYIVYDAAQVRMRYLVELDNGAPLEQGEEGAAKQDAEEDQQEAQAEVAEESSDEEDDDSEDME